MTNLQQFFDALSTVSRNERSLYHLTLGEFVDALKTVPPETAVVFSDTGRSPCKPHSYRGYYSDLAFEEQSPPRLAADVLADAAGALDATFQGYKGGDFKMTADTPLWASPYGTNSGRAMMSCSAADGRLVISIKQVD